MVRHWTPKPVIICSIRSSPTGGNFFFAVVKSFKYKIAISANFVQTVKNSIVSIDYCLKVHNAHEKQVTLSSGLRDTISTGADPGGRRDPRFWGPRIEHFWALFDFSIIFFVPHFTRHIISLICYFFIVQIQKCSSLASLGIWFLTYKSLFLVLVSHILGY